MKSARVRWERHNVALLAELYKTAISLTYEEQRFDERRKNLNLCKSRLTFSQLVMVRSR